MTDVSRRGKQGFLGMLYYPLEAQECQANDANTAKIGARDEPRPIGLCLATLHSHRSRAKQDNGRTR